MTEDLTGAEDGSEQEGKSSDPLFPLSTRDLQILRELSDEVRRVLSSENAFFIRSAACAILVIERLPRPTSGALVEISYKTFGSPGNWGWADITLGYDEIHASIGEHFYDSAVGGDTESETLFSAELDADRCTGDLEEWFEHAKGIAENGILEVSDQSEADAIDWWAED